MPENAPHQPNSSPVEYDPVHASLQWLQQQLDEQGIAVSSEEALKLFEQKILYNIRRGIQQDLAEQGIDVSPEEADATTWLQLYRPHVKHIGTTDPHEAT